MSVNVVTSRPQTGRQVTRVSYPYEFKILPLGQLFVDHIYQRPLSRFYKTIVEDYDERLLGVYIVSQRSETSYAILDGQSRQAAENELGHLVAPCLTYKNLTRKEEAQIFADLQSKRRNVSAIERFKALLIAEDPKALYVNSVVERVGMVIEKSAAGNSIVAVKALQDIYDRTGGDILVTTLSVISRAWRHQKKGSNSNEMLRGLAWFLTHYGKGEVDITRLINRLSIQDPRDLHIDAVKLRQGRGMGGRSPSYMAHAIEAVYEK